MRLQYRLSNGTWIDCGDRTDEFLQRTVKYHRIYDKQTDTLQSVSIDEILDILSSGKTVRNHDEDWYSECRDGEVIDRIRSEYMAKQKPAKYKTCDCGHTVPTSQVMTASMGTSCPDCYDRMSD